MPTRIKSIGFRMLSPEMIKKMARVRIVNSELYDADGYPIEGGVMDPRLGVIDPGLYCRTCNSGIGDCLGHFGYLELARPIIHVLYVKHVYEMLKIICQKCSALMAETDITHKSMLQPNKCPKCKAKQKKVKFVKPYTYYEEADELDPMIIRERFEKVSDGDAAKMGFKGGRPEWLIITLFPIPPVTMRPSITLETGERSEDDLTHKLVDIVRINQSLKENIEIGAPDFIIRDLWELLQYHVSTYFDNELTGAPLARHRSGRPLKGLIQRLKAKEGRLRGNLLGKRVNFSARTVIAPDPRLSINEVGIPEVVARELSIPVAVTDFSKKVVADLIRHDKVNYVTRPDARKIKITEDNRKEILSSIDTGWLADRQLQDGDIVLFNRQPSLHRISIMAHRVRLMPYNSFRINPSVCFPYNADFDGDEMNLHALQNEEARVEANYLMLVEKNIISPKLGAPVIGLDLDNISGMFLLTDKNLSLDKRETARLLALAGIDIDIPDKERFTGKEIFSLILPSGLNAKFDSNFSKNFTPEQKQAQDGIVVIKDGKLFSGRIDAAAVGPEKGLIISRINRLWGPEKVSEFIDRTARLASSYLLMRGFSIGLSDLDIIPHVKKEITSNLEEAQKKANSFIHHFKAETMEILPGMTPEESLEAHILKVLAKTISDLSIMVSSSIRESDLVMMAKSGSKGSYINITQMIAAVGQETILGERIRNGYIDRTLPHVLPHDLSPSSKGFVAHGFRTGLQPFEVFWDIMNGREGLMDKSLRTRKSGYMQRRLVNALQDLKIGHDRSVRNSLGDIVQFRAGEDAVDVAKSDFGRFDWKAAIGIQE